MRNSSTEANRKRKEWRRESGRKGGSTPKSPRQTTEAPSTTGEGTSTETMPSTLNAEPSRRSNPRPLSTAPIRRHARVRPTTVHKETSTDFRAAVQSTQTVLETVDCSTQTETEQESIQRLCAELNKAKRRIETLERQLEKKTDEVKRLKKRPAEKHRHRLKRVSSLDDLSRQSRTTRAKEIARNLSDLFRPGTPIPEIDKVVRQARHQANFISPKKPPGKWTRKGRTRKKERISPILDIQVTLMLGFSWNQRQQLKNTLINMRDDGTAGGMDFLASTHEVKALRRRLTTHARFEVVNSEGGTTLICTNIRQVLVQRVETLLGQGRMKEFDEKLFVAIVGDRGFKDVRPVLREMLDQLQHPIIDTVERQSGMDREQLFYTVVVLLTFYLLFGSYNIFVSNVLVKSYPVYQSVMTIRSQSKADDTQWLAYWCAFALFSLVDHFIAPFGPYLLLKTAVLVYMLLPQTYGAHNCFVNYVQPMMERFAERRARRHAH
ncbi:hypothetical protein niasHT_003155 [Heterodera trifolii]|uniref:Uncharacterized protein n=1 Tax=Heterodera trifolii TaxID=157864 RepID=A0ABD2M3R1_9BILA